MSLRRDPRLLGYVVLTLFGLYAVAGWLIPPAARQGCQIAYVYDGDTVDLLCGAVHSTARLTGFDTPEAKNPGCAAEKALADKATVRLRALVRAGRDFAILDEGRDRYGRDLVALRIDGLAVADILIAEGLATEYDGGARVNWCDRIGG